MNELIKRFIERELDAIAKPSSNAGSLHGLNAQRRHLEGFGRAVMLYGEMDEDAFLQLRRDAYVAFTLGTKHALSHGVFDLGRQSRGTSSGDRNEEVELFGSVEAADEVFRNQRSQPR